MQINSFIDHTLLKPEATLADIHKLCSEAQEYQFYSVCVAPTWVSQCQKALSGSDVKVCSVVGFPLGYSSTESKVFEIEQLTKLDCDEMDFVVNLGHVFDENWQFIEKEFSSIRQATPNTLKVILETGLTNEAQVSKLCELASKTGIEFVKTSTGFCKDSSASTDWVQLMKKSCGPNTKIKASGGIRDFSTAKKMIDAGAERLGCSASIKISKGAQI